MKKLLWLFLLSGIAATAQKNLTIQEATFGQYQAYAPKSLVSPAWRPDSKTITYLDNTYQNLMARSEDGKWEETTLITKAQLASALKTQFSSDTFELQMFPYAYKWSDKNTLSLEVEGKNKNYLVLFDADKKEVKSAVAIPHDASQQVLSPNGKNASWLNENNIVITLNGKDINVTNDTDKGIVNGSDYVHRQEFGIDKGMWWSADSNKLLFYRKDETMVANYPLTNWDERIASTKDIKYPMAGMKSEEVTLVVYDITSGKSTTLKTEGPKEQFLTCVTWSPDSKKVYVGVLNREQNHLKLNRYDAVTGNFEKTLFEEQASTYVEPLHDLTFVPGKNDQFLYRTEKDGFEQLYLYNTDGKLLKKLGFKDVVITDLLNFDKDAKNVFYIGTANNGLDRQLFKAELKSGKTTQITTISGTHSAIVSTDGTLALDSFSNTTTPK